MKLGLPDINLDDYLEEAGNSPYTLRHDIFQRRLLERTFGDNSTTVRVS